MKSPYPCGCSPKFDSATKKDVPFCKAQQGHSAVIGCAINWKPAPNLNGAIGPDGHDVTAVYALFTCKTGAGVPLDQESFLPPAPDEQTLKGGATIPHSTDEPE